MYKEDQELVKLMAEIIGLVTDLTPEQVLAKARERAANQRRRMAQKHARFQAALAHMTDQQSLRVAQQEARGYKLNKLFQHRVTGRVAIMLVNDQMWNTVKGRMGTKIMVVYPDATSSETFEKSISVKQDF